MHKEDLIMNAGRIIDVEYTLEDLADDYIRNVLNLVTLLQGKIVVFDFDGTLTRFQYAKDRILPCDEEDLYEYSKTHNIYDNAKIIKTMQYVMSQLNTDNIYIVTNSVDTIKEKKNEFIKSTCSFVLPEHIIHTKSKEHKLDIMAELHNRFNRDIIFVEDMAPNIQLMEENTDFIKGYHISSLLA